MFPQIFGKYVLERELAAGGMARVYLATLRGAVGFEKRLVVKQIRPELASDPAFVRRFVEEAKTAVELSHANIVPVYELGVEHGVYYIAMELCAGLTLAEVLADAGKLSPEEGAYLGSEICSALDHAHRRAGIVHRDVTPRNVLVDEDGAVRLIDFGIAAPATPSDGARPEIFGSPGHMPPEQLAGGPLTPATDVFAVAALLVEVWTGRAPFRRSSARDSERALALPIARIDADEPALAPLAEHVSRALALAASERPAQAELFARPLRDFLRSVDSVDVGRQLGARVQHAQRRARAGERATPVPPASTSAEQSTPERRGAAAPTRTFAAREEVVEWTRRLDSAPPEADVSRTGAVGTRKLLSPLPDAPSSAEHVPGRPNQNLLRVIAVATLLALVLVALQGSLRTPGPSPAQSSVARVAVSPPRSPSSSPSAAPSAAPIGLAPFVAASARAVSSASLTSPSGGLATASLRLTADPPATVRVSGAGVSRSFHTPVRELKLPAGSYAVTFQSGTYASPLQTRVLLAGGAQRSVHADFREAEPRVSVR